MAAISIVIVVILLMVAGLFLSAERTKGKSKVVPEASIPRNKKGKDMEEIISQEDITNLLWNRPPLKPGKLKTLQDTIQKIQGGLERFLYKIGLIGFPGTPVSFVLKLNFDPNTETEWEIKKNKTRSGTGIVYQFLADQYWIANITPEELVKKYLSLIYETGAIKIKEAEFKSRGFQAIMEFLEKGKKKPQTQPVPKEIPTAPEKKEKEKKEETPSQKKETKRTKGNSSSQSLSKEEQKKIESEILEIEKRRKENAKIFGEEIAENVYKTERENLLRNFRQLAKK